MLLSVPETGRQHVSHSPFICEHEVRSGVVLCLKGVGGNPIK